MLKNFSYEEIHRILSNPIHCLPKINDSFIKEHEPSIDEKQWINTNAKLMEQIGTKKWLGLLLENLKNDAIPADIYNKVQELNV